MTDSTSTPNIDNGNGPTEAPRSSRELIVMLDSSQQAAAMTGENGLRDVLASAGASMRPLFEDKEATAEGAAFLSESGTAQYFHVDADEGKLDDLCEQIRMQPGVVAAYVKPPAEVPAAVEGQLLADEDNVVPINDMAPAAENPPAATPNFVNRQGYLNPAPEGVDAYYAWRFPGGRGDNIDVIDLEWGWRFSHEDLLVNQDGIVDGSGSSSTNHGTAVLGEISGDVNSFGITGIAPRARVSAVAFSMPTATAIRSAADRLNAGDIMLLEIHRAGPRHNFQARADQRGYIAVEWWPDDFAAIRYATAKGIIVVEAAGNGAENFDDSLYDQRPMGFPVTWRNPFDPANPSSAAVMVGAGAPPPGTHGRDHGPDRSRLGFSNYGARVDAQGWGREVTTTGYGDLQGGADPDRWYTDTFSGTSSASPIVVGALACVNGALRANGQSMLSSLQAISLLRSTGSPQTDAPGRPASQRIGNRPDLKQMLNLYIKPRHLYTGVWRAGNDKHYLWVNASWSSFVSKWQQLAPYNLRLTDFEIAKYGSSYRYSGVWREGTDPYYLWVNASWSSFVSKWQQLGQNNLRLVDIEIKPIGSSWRYSGVWRGGSDPYYLWVNASWSSFVSKWQQLSAKNMRLVDIEIRKIGDAYRYTGVWRHGTGGHYLWVNASWSSFVSKWQQLAPYNLRLTKIVRTNINGQWRYSGIWRPGSDSYYLWVNASWQSFVDKWQQLSSQGLRLVDFEEALEGDTAPSAPGMETMETIPMIDLDDSNTDGFGGGDTATHTASGGSSPTSDAPAVGKGGGDFGGGFQLASLEETAAMPGSAQPDGGDGYGGGVLPDEMEMADQAAGPTSSATLDLGEVDDGSGYGGGDGIGELVEEPLTATDDGLGFGGGTAA